MCCVMAALASFPVEVEVEVEVEGQGSSLTFGRMGSPGITWSTWHVSTGVVPTPTHSVQAEEDYKVSI